MLLTNIAIDFAAGSSLSGHIMALTGQFAGRKLLNQRRWLSVAFTTFALMSCSGGGSSDQSGTGPGQPPSGPPPDATPALRLLAGNMGSAGEVDGPVSIARLSSPGGIAADAAGNIYVGSSSNIRKITPTGLVSTFASNVGEVVAADAGGAVFVVDNDPIAQHAFRIRRIAPDGNGTTVVSTTQLASPAWGDTSIVASVGVALNAAGDLFVAQNGSFDPGSGIGFFSLIHKISPTGSISLLAGSPIETGYVDGDATQARFKYITALAADSQGGVWVADGTTTRYVSASGSVSTVAGLGGASDVLDGVGAGARFNNGRWRFIAILDEQSVLVTDYGGTIRKVTRSGVVSTLAGKPLEWQCPDYADGPGATACFGWFLNGIAVSGGAAFVADFANSVVRRMDGNSVVSTYAGSPPLAGHVDGKGAVARFVSPTGIALTPIGYLHVVDGGLRVVSPSGDVTTIPFPDFGFRTAEHHVCGIAVDSAGSTYLTETGADSLPAPPFVGPEFSGVRKIETSGRIVLVTGGLAVNGSQDGPRGSGASFRNPCGIAVDAAGNLFVADTGNHTIRRISADGDVTTLAGLAGVPGHQDGIGSKARFQGPTGVALGSGGILYVADTGTHTIRKVSPDGTVTTLAGQPFNPGAADGTGNAAQFRAPEGLTVGRGDVVYVADTGNATVRRIATDGTVTTPIGTPGASSFLEGPLPGYIGSPHQLVIDGTSLYITMHNGIAVVRNVP